MLITEFAGIAILHAARILRVSYCAFHLLCVGVVSEGAGKLPDSWDPMSPGETYKLVNLAATSTEYQQVEQKFKTSMQAGGCTYNAIAQVSSDLRNYDPVD